MRIKHLFHAYDESGFVIKDLSLTVEKGSFFALMGENGSGKTTLLKLIAGIIKTKRGRISTDGSKIAMLPQSCEALFAGPTIMDDMLFALSGSGLSKEEKLELIGERARFFEIGDILSQHPYDVSGGEMQRSALALIMLGEPDMLLLDEPTKGMDEPFKRRLGEKLKKLCAGGLTVFAVCHDAEFCASFADECAMLFDGRVVSKQAANQFFSSNYFYTTNACRLTRGFIDGVTTEEQVRALCEKSF